MKIIKNVKELVGRKFYLYAMSREDAEKYKAPDKHKFFIVQFTDGNKERGLLYVLVEKAKNFYPTARDADANAPHTQQVGAKMQKYLDEIKQIRESETLDRDPELVAFMVREWSCTKEAGLKGLCWAMCHDGYATKNDAVFLLDMLEAHLTKREA